MFLFHVLLACTTPAPEAPTPASPAPVRADPALPDVVVITLDTTRTDHLSLYGWFRDTSPTLDALGAESVVFDRLVVPMATTLPTHTSLFTGVWPEEHGVLANVQHGGQRVSAAEGLTSFATWFDAVGYQTAAFVSAAPLEAGTGMERGFQTFSDADGFQRLADETTDEALAWLADAADAPMLLWVHYYDPHNPFAPPPPYDTTYDPKDPRYAAWMEARGVTPVAKRPTGIPVFAKKAGALYDGEIRFMDDQLARLLEGLEQRDRFADAVVVVAGDHGEGLNQHGQPGHGLVWEEQLRAPLLMRLPGQAPRRVSALVSIADVLPTALAHAGATWPGAEGWLAQTTGTDALADGFAERPVLSQTSARQLMFGRPMTYTLTASRWKCRWEARGPQEDVDEGVLYDLDADPHELAPVDDPEERDRCVAALRAELAAQKQRLADRGAGDVQALDSEQLEALRTLGYLEGDAPEDP